MKARLTLAALFAVMVTTVSKAEETQMNMVIQRTSPPANIPFGVIGGQQGGSAPTLILIAMSLDDAQHDQESYTGVGRLLAAEGFLTVVIEPPCQGEDRRPGEAEGLAGWRQRLDRGEDMMQAFKSKVRTVLDHVVAQRLADPERLAICGISRGGFLSFHFAATEPRIKAIAAISPVTELSALHEFAGSTPDGVADKLSLKHLVPQLAGRPVWVGIGNHDMRVDTDRAIAFTRELVHAAAGQSKKPDPLIPVELIVVSGEGHRQIEKAHELVATWLVRQLPRAPMSPGKNESLKP